MAPSPIGQESAVVRVVETEAMDVAYAVLFDRVMSVEDSR